MNRAELDLNLLWALDALLRERHVTRAGESIGLGQPAMSAALGRLRRLFRDELLVRVGRRYYLTPLAVELVQPVHEILREIEQTVERRPLFDPAIDERAFTITASDLAAVLVLRPVLKRVVEQAPRLSIRIQPPSRSTTEELEAGDLDLVIWPPEFGPKMPCEILLRDRWVCAVWEHHPEVREGLTMEQYVALPHAVFGRGPILGGAERAFEGLQANRHVQVTTESFFSLPFLLAETPLVALIPERLGESFGRTAGIRIIPPPFETPPIAEAMFWHPRNTTDPAHQWLRELVKETSAGR